MFTNRYNKRKNQKGGFMERIIFSPMKYVQGPGAWSKLADYAGGLSTTGAYVVAGPHIIKHYWKGIEESFAAKNLPLYSHTFSRECSMAEIKRIVNEIHEKNCGVIIGIGGGKTLDTAKAAAYYAKLPVIIAPSIASTDAPCSALSVIYTEEGAFESYLILRNNPDVVLVDTAIIAQSPVRMLVAGMGDALATYYEARACFASGKATTAGGRSSLSALAIARACRDSLFKNGLRAKLAAEAKAVSSALDDIVETNTYMSGVGFESGGLAAAHAIHNGLTVLPQTHSAMHGEKVAFGLLAQLALENAPQEEFNEVLSFCRAIGLPTNLAALGLKDASDEELKKVAEASCAAGETIHNMPFAVTPPAVFAAIKVADKLGS